MGWARLLPFLLIACTSLDEDPEGVLDGGGGDARARTDAGASDLEAGAHDATPLPDAPASDGGNLDSGGGDLRDGGAPELCNAFDDDGDLRIDEGLAVFRTTATYAMLDRYGCNAPYRAIGACMEAARGYCIASFGSCSTSGAGSLTDTSVTTEIVCLGSGYDEVEISFVDLTETTEITITSATAVTRLAQSAVHEWCRRRVPGAVAGFGPTYVDERGGERLRAICLDVGEGATLGTNVADLGMLGCTYPDQADTVACSQAADVLCRRSGWEGGIGPIDSDGVPAAVCVGDEEP